MENKQKKVSLILTTFNCGDNLIKTLDSIKKQDYPDIEVVIKDGGSTDGTLEVIREYQENSALDIHTKSQKDTGIYDAMNQGYAMSTGDVIAFFNDVFTEPSAVSKLVAAIDDGYVGVHADLVYKDGERIVRKWNMGKGSIYGGWLPGHPTLFLKREIFEKYGLFDTSYRISADYEFMVRFLKDEENQLAYVPETLVSMFYGGASSGGLKNYIRSLVEGHHGLKKNRIRMAWWIDVRRTIRVLMQFISR